MHIRITKAVFQFNTTAALVRHKAAYNHNRGSSNLCHYCGQRFDTARQVTAHMDAEHFGPHYTVKQHAFNRSIEVVERTWSEVTAPRSLEELYKEEWKSVVEMIRIYVHRYKALKLYCVFSAIFNRYDDSGNVLDTVHMPMRTSAFTLVLYNLYQVRAILAHMFEEISLRFDGMEEQGSDLSLSHFTSLTLNFAKYNIAGGGSGHVLPGSHIESDEVEEPFLNEIPKVTKDGLTFAQRKVLIDCDTHRKNFCFFTAFAMGFSKVNPKCKGNIPNSEFRPGGSRFEKAKKFIESEVFYESMPVPMPVKQLHKFESLNSHLQFCLNVFLLEKVESKTEIIPMYLSKNTADAKKRTIINLLIVRHCHNLKTYDDEEEDSSSATDSDDDSGGGNLKTYVKKDAGRGRFSVVGKERANKCDKNYAHYLYISNISKLFQTVSKNRKVEKFVCCNCMHSLSTKMSLKSHQKNCLSYKPQKIEMPEPGECISFKNHKHCVKMPIFLVADFETCMVEKDDEQVRRDYDRLYNGDNEKSFTTTLHDQIPITCSLTFISAHEKVLEQRVFSAASDLPLHFYRNLAEMYDKWKVYLNDVPICPPLTPSEYHAYITATKCYLCNRTFGPDDDKNWRRVKDHEHSSLLGGKFLGACHSRCNLDRQKQTFIPAFLHNFKNFDANFVLQTLRYDEVIKDMKRRKCSVSALPDNSEHFKTVNMINYKFLDSFSFLSMSLSKLIENLGDEYNFPLTRQMQYKGRPLADIDMTLLKRKSIFPYEMFRDKQHLADTTEFPPKSAFFSTLTQSDISEEDYLHGLTMFEKFKCENMLEYLEIYCLLDTLLLADAVNQFRNSTFDEFGLDICHYISSPQISFDIFLKTTGVSIEMISDMEQLNMIEQAIRGGLSYADTRYANVGENFSPSETQEWMLFLDVNNLYGYAMMYQLPVGQYMWVGKDEFSKINWLDQTEDQQVGYILMVDLSIPPHLHDYFKCFPVPCDKFSPTMGELSQHSRAIYSMLHHVGGKPIPPDRSSGKEKLTGTLLPKKNYVIHYTHLKLLLQLGVSLDAVHKCLSFKQSSFLREYVLRMTSKRMLAKSKSLADHYKLFTNSIYGKLIEGIRSFMNCKFVLSPRLLGRYISDNRFERFQIIGEQAVVFYRKQKVVKMNKAYLCGFSVLERSKMYVEHTFYNKILPEIGVENISLLMTDTDSLMIRGKNCTLDEAVRKLEPILDFSNYPKNHPLFDESRKQVPGYWKNECPNGDIIECTAIKSKCYKYRVKPNKYSLIQSFKQPRAKCKGISSNFVDNLTMEMYRNTVKQNMIYHTSTFHIRSRSFNVSTIETRKMALNSYCTKRYVLACGEHSLPFGHKDIPILKQSNDKCSICAEK